MDTLTLVLVLLGTLVLPGLTPQAQAASLALDWDYPADQLVERFRVWRTPGACPPATAPTTPLMTTLGTARSVEDPSPLAGMACYTVTALAPAVPANAVWTACATEGGTCTFAGTQVVRYGATGRYVTITGPSPVPCSHTVFGDPLPGVPKTCTRTTPTGPLTDGPPSNRVQQPASGVLAPTMFRLVPE